jgi:hypothetical protein
VDEAHCRHRVLGDRVAVMLMDYGIDPVDGEFVLSLASEFRLRRIDLTPRFPTQEGLTSFRQETKHEKFPE